MASPVCLLALRGGCWLIFGMPPPRPCPAGEWNGTTTAVKVLEHQEAEGGGDLLEALLSTQISHPNVVRARLKGRPIQLSTQIYIAPQRGESLKGKPTKMSVQMYTGYVECLEYIFSEVLAPFPVEFELFPRTPPRLVAHVQALLQGLADCV